MGIEDRDHRAKIAPGTRVKNISPRADPLHAPADLRDSQRRGATPFFWVRHPMQ